jgi:hypothetical protein
MRRQDIRKGDGEKEKKISRWRKRRGREREEKFSSGVRVAAAHPVVKCGIEVVLLEVRFEGNCDCVRV